MFDEKNVPALREAFANAACRGHGTFLFVDQVNSTLRKTTTPESAWLPQLGFMYDTITTLVYGNGVGSPAPDDSSEVHIKFLGDGVLVSYDGDDSALLAIQTAIQIQEIFAAAATMVDGAMGSIDFNVSIGIASGLAHRFRAPNGSIDHAGLTVDRAARLCAAASPKAVFIDKATQDAANFLRVKSKMGEVFNRTAAEYAGDKQTAALKGMQQPVEYFEVLWEKQLFGLKSAAVTLSTTSAPTTSGAPVVSLPTEAKGAGRFERIVGEVKYWAKGKPFGFVTSSAGEDFYCAPNLLVYAEDVEKMTAGTKVAFIALEPIAEGRARRAGALLLAGEPADGTLVSVPTKERNYGWVEVKDGAGNGQLVFMPAGPSTAHLAKGDTVSFMLEVTAKGARAAAPEQEDAA
jgi:class 3 adenylate cyclase/cold shock CspA family protein